MITIVEPFLGVLASGFMKRGLGEKWSKAQSLGMLLEILVDYIVLIFLVFMATRFSKTNLQYDMLGYSLKLTKEGWALLFIIIVFISALLWKQSKKEVFATVNLKTSPNWLNCLLWCIPNLFLMFATTHFLFNVKAV